MPWAMVDMSALEATSSGSLVERILEQGQRLRNAMVQTILNNDPFNKELLRNGGSCAASGGGGDGETYGGKGARDAWHVHQYLDGAEMGVGEEMRALETLRSMSPLSLIQSTACVRHDTKPCDICETYESRVGRPGAASASKAVPTVESPKIASENRYDALRYVDSLKVYVYSMRLTSAGRKKVSAPESTLKPHSSGGCTYFVEYTVPDALLKPVPRTRAKVNTGLQPAKTVRFASKKLHHESVYFRQQALHLIAGARTLDLSTEHIAFRVSFRGVRERTARALGVARLNLDALAHHPFLSSEQELVVCGEQAPLVLATLKVTAQLGCDRLYFGREFIDAVSGSKENAKLSDSDSLYKQFEAEPAKGAALTAANRNTERQLSPRAVLPARATSVPVGTRDTGPATDDDKHLLYALIFVSEVRVAGQPADLYVVCHGLTADDVCTSRTVLNSANPVFDLYQVIPVLWTDELVTRLRDNYVLVELWQKRQRAGDRLIGIAKLPLHQLYVAYRNPAIVKHLARNQFPVIGVDWWDTVTEPGSSRDSGQIRALVALGTHAQVEALAAARRVRQSTVPTNPYTGRLVGDTASKPGPGGDTASKPGPGGDWWATRTATTSAGGQAHRSALLAQFDGRPARSYVPDRVPQFPAERPTDWATEFDRRFASRIKAGAAAKPVVPTRTVYVADKGVQEPEHPATGRHDGRTVDASTQSEPVSVAGMDAEQTSDKATTTPPASQRDFFHSFLEQLIATRDLHQRNRHVENSTNTEHEAPVTPAAATTVANPLYVDTASPPQTAVGPAQLSVRNTSDLLDSLQQALSASSRTEAEPVRADCTEDTFKVHIVVDSALHLPSRRKCRSKRNRTRPPAKASEELLPSTYVTFKCDPEAEDCVTSAVVARSTSPRWDHRCDTRLPAELLLNNQKRLIFKVWRLAHGPSLQPNFDTDVVLGFAALDLTVLLSGLPAVHGWFNIVDFSSKCNGQIKIHVTPLESLARFSTHRRTCLPARTPPEPTPGPEQGAPADVLSRALKRKFTELDEITQRLRQRLSAVTNDDSDGSLDERFLDEFERDLNTECSERAPDAPSSGSEVSSAPAQLATLDAHLADGKLKIDTLLEKLTLLTGEPDTPTVARTFSSRYVSGCSVHQDVEAPVLADIGLAGHERLDPDLIFNPLLFQRMLAGSVESTPRLQDSLEGSARAQGAATTLHSLLAGSLSASTSSSGADGASVASVCDGKRHLPDGAGNSSVDSLL